MIVQPVWLVVQVYVFVPVTCIVYPDICASNPVRVKAILFVPVILIPLVGYIPVTDGAIVSMVNVIPVELPA